ncbi:uncharacterized protein [Halyomorpha halys]|uniref:uncharacterized protein n=1 Tax=Halyomorpha halys TaxID=286706 RepID=UPI0006D4EEC5|nr:uncharacterized protein LOC106690069 [Halyomorpha halys]
MNCNLNTFIPVPCKIIRSTMMCVLLTAFFSLSVMCEGRTLIDQTIPGPQSIGPLQSTNHTDNLKDLMKVIMEAIDSAKSSGEGFAPNQEQMESLVMELSPDKRKVLNEILGLVVSKPEDNIYHKPQNVKKPQVAKQIEVFTLPPGRSINIHELLKFLLEPSVTTPSDLDHLRKLIYDYQMTDLRQDPVLKKTFNKFLLDSNLQVHQIDQID